VCSPGGQRVAEFCSIGEAADYLAVTERSVRRYIAEGKIPGYRVGEKLVRLRFEDVAALVVRIPTGDAA
jgi:excisionase family DNA binding protein